MNKLRGALLLVALATAAPAAALAADNLKECLDTSATVALAACTRAIESGRYRGDNLAKLYLKRGREKAVLGDSDGALCDLGKAVEFNPDDKDALAEYLG